MKVKDLIAKLSQYREDMEVFVCEPTHDYWSTEKARTPTPNLGIIQQENHRVTNENSQEETVQVLLL